MMDNGQWIAKKWVICMVYSIFCSLFSVVNAQTKTWRNHADYVSAQGLAVLGSKIYCHTPNGLFYYDTETQRSKTLSKVEGLSENRISTLASSNKLLLAAYASGQIDFLSENGIEPFSIIRASATVQGSKRINHILIHNNFAYLSCDFGVLLLDIEKRNIRETYRYIAANAQQIQALEATIRNDSLFVRTPTQVLTTAMTVNTNLQDFRNWKSNGVIFPNSKQVTLPTHSLLVSPQSFIEKNGIWWIADAKNGLLSNWEGDFKSYSPNGLVGETRKIKQIDDKIVAFGTETKIFNGESWQKTALKNVTDVVQSSNGWTWEVANGQIVVRNPKTEQSRILNQAPNEGALQGRALCLAIDRSNRLWVGTDNGVSVLSISENIFSGAVNASSPFYERRRLLIQERVQAIAVDGGNRKWIGTPNALYLFGDDGDQLIEIFNTDNSPLPSKQILDIAVLNSGEVFVLTDDGLISYKSDAETPAETLDNASIFPNPVRPQFDGLLTIKGLSDNTDIRITDLSGRLVHQTRSNGGIATWDLQYQSQRLTQGIYLVFCTNENGTENIVGKFAVVR